MLTLELNAQERQLLIEILEAAENNSHHALHHADSSEYKRMLRGRLEMIEQVRDRLNAERAEPSVAKSRA